MRQAQSEDAVAASSTAVSALVYRMIMIMNKYIIFQSKRHSYLCMLRVSGDECPQLTDQILMQYLARSCANLKGVKVSGLEGRCNTEMHDQEV